MPSSKNASSSKFSKCIPVEEASQRIGSGWLLQYRGTGMISRSIQYATGSVHSHSAMSQVIPSQVIPSYESCRIAGVDPQNSTQTKSHQPEFRHIDILELREFVGGRRRTLEWHVAKFGGAIDVFSPNAGGRWGNDWDAIAATARMRRLCDQDYGYLGVLKLALRSVPLVWRLFPVEAGKAESGQEAPFCSQAVTLAVMAGGVDPVPHLPSHRVTPGMLTRSLFFQYEFTIGESK